MRPLLILTVATSAVVGLTAPTSAQILDPEIETGSLLKAKPQKLDRNETAVLSKSFAQCIYRRAKPKALALLAHSDMEAVDFRGAGIRDPLKELALETCLGEQAQFDQPTLGMSFPAPVLRDLLAEEAYLATNSVAPAVTAEATSITLATVSTGDAQAKAQAVWAFADCTVRHNAAGADALLRTAPASDAERSAAAALAPALGQCLVAGQSLALKPANIRAFIAFAMWSRFGRSEIAQ